MRMSDCVPVPGVACVALSHHVKPGPQDLRRCGQPAILLGFRVQGIGFRAWALEFGGSSWGCIESDG